MIAAGASYFMFSTPDQIQELYLIFASDLRDSLIKIVTFLLTAMLLCLSINQSARRVWTDRTGLKPTRLQAAIACLIGVVPAVGIAVGLHRSAGYFGLADLNEVLARLAENPLSGEGSNYFDRLTSNFRDLHRAALLGISSLKWASLICVVVAAVFVLVELVYRRGQGNPWWFRMLENNIFIASCILICVGSLQTLSDLKTVSAFLIMISASVGTLTWLALFFVVLLFFLIRLQTMSRRAGLSIAGLLILVALVSDWAGLNDNHTVRTVASATNAESGNLVQDEFYEWWQRRPTERVEAFKALGRSFPVYIVAARGGGLYAAYQTATTLARLYDRCPAIIDHIFLVSSVSGGSIGAAAFSAAIQAEPAPDKTQCSTSKSTSRGKIEALLDRFFASDFLAPLAASALFPDFAQRFLPYPVPAFDRARALERALEVAWVDATSGKSDAFSKGIVQDRKTGAGPILFMNITQAETGEQQVIAPTSDSIEWGRSAVTSAFVSSSETDIALSTAATLSSRFPVILPPASVALEKEPGKWSLWPRIVTRFVDGGYFENSGADTAVKIVRWLEWEAPAESVVKPGQTPESGKQFPEFVFKVIVLGHSAHYSRLYEGAKIIPNSFSELLTPVDAFLQTREVRGDQAVQRAIDLFNSGPALNGERYRVYQVNLNHRFFKFPLGWQLSSITRRLIAANVSDAGVCNDPGQGAFQESGVIEGPNGVPGGMTGFVESFQQNACEQCKIIKEVETGLTSPKPKPEPDQGTDFCS
ncbi:hypothetical protein KMZ93_11060 [Bradyrhizobium sediminis]|uniref:PNPLA domain-containing protein n=1 Tax=Bradyrhizobium sediminis TaxID=2840469 RepID=A0A975P2F5_9BRAD|nr:patatin-like phospholipase family protein [Bradyrhizobium sediminis]QWG25370.1 hypothetical protein KMZ93_11060 [Bradyrhizobium sediminis]